MTKYIVGFLLSVLLTISAYIIVVNHIASDITAVVLIGVLALIQATVQLVFFLHLFKHGSKWRLWAFISMFIVLGIIVVGSVWIMNHLNYNMMHMSNDQLTQKLDKESGF